MAVREIQESPPLASWFPVAAERKHCVWLDGKSDAPSAVWSVLAWDPVEVREGSEEDLLGWMDEVGGWNSGEDCEVPFEGGLIGQFDYAEEVEPYPPTKRFSLAGWLGLYDRALVEHLPSGRIFAVVAEWRSDAKGMLEGWVEELAGGRATVAPSPRRIRASAVASDHSAAEYEQGVAKIREWIAAGDIYQANLAQRFSCEVEDGRAADFFLSLRKENPAPYSVYLDCGKRKILSTSPELFLSLDGKGGIRTRPIKGTRPRSVDSREDDRLLSSLRSDPKELAELLMIVDMERNDLGRICRPGSVRAAREFAVESFTSVHHLVGDVSGVLRENVSWSDVFAATFPGGSITGAPKRRAMEIIRTTEKSTRGAFCGAVGYVSSGGRGDWSIAIRTLEWIGRRIEFGVGSGIVWDSDPASEYRETLHKARRIFCALGRPRDETELTP